MLEQMNAGRSPTQNVVESLQKWETRGNIKMDLNSSIVGTIGGPGTGGKAEAKDESVEELIKKLQVRGTKVVIQKEDEDMPNTMTPKQNSTKKKDVSSTNKENSQPEKPLTSLSQNEQRAAGSESKLEASRLEELQKRNREIALEQEKQAQQNEKLHSELLSKEQALEGEKRQKDELGKLIREMEKKLVVGGHGMDGLSEINKEQIRKERVL